MRDIEKLINDMQTINKNLDKKFKKNYNEGFNDGIASAMHMIADFRKHLNHELDYTYLHSEEPRKILTQEDYLYIVEELNRLIKPF